MWGWSADRSSGIPSSNVCIIWTSEGACSPEGSTIVASCRKMDNGWIRHSNDAWILVPPVPRRDAGTLLPIIVGWVQSGSIVWSDEWAVYNQLGQQGFTHGPVNHTLHFVDPATGVSTHRVDECGKERRRRSRQCMDR